MGQRENLNGGAGNASLRKPRWGVLEQVWLSECPAPSSHFTQSPDEAALGSVASGEAVCC